jgi:hypothetical protein
VPLIGLWLLGLLLAVLIDAGPAPTSPIHPKPIDDLRTSAGPKDA